MRYLTRVDPTATATSGPLVPTASVVPLAGMASIAPLPFS